VLPAVISVRQLLAPGLQPVPIALNDIVPVGADEAGPTLAILGVSTNDEALILPLELAYSAEWALPTLRAAFAKTRTGRREGLLVDAGIDDRLWCGLFDAVRTNAVLPGSAGALHCEPTWSLESLPIADERNLRRPQSGDRRLSAVIGDTVLLTLYRRSLRGTNPAIELARFLHDANFTHTATLLGTFTYRGADSGEVGVGLARRYILAQGSGWDVLHTMFMRSLQLATDDSAPIDRVVGLAGRRLAYMHALLARSDHPDFVPRAFTAEDAATLQNELRDLAERAFTQIARDRSPEAAAALALRAQIERFIADAPLIGARAMRVHGDFHLERVLVTESDVLIIDPGVGEAARPATQRRRRTSPFADVATMIRSLDEVAAAAAFDVTTDPTVDTAQVARALQPLVRAAATTFARSYLEHARELDMPYERDDVRRLVDIFLVRATLEAIVYQAHARAERMRDLYAEFTRIFERSEVASSS
jgi:maltose alpha-D-glucosyltransferase/alpha-amylase